MSSNRWLWSWRTLRRLGAVNHIDLAKICVLSILTTAMEGIGIALMLPLLDFIQHRGDITALSTNGYWKYVEQGFALFNVTVTLKSLAVVVFITVLLRESISYTANLVNNRMTIAVEMNMRNSLVRKTLASRILSTDTLGSGAFVELVYGQCRNAAILVDQFIDFWKLSITVGAYAFLAISAAPVVSVLSAVALGISAVSVNWLVGTVRRVSNVFVQEQKRFAGWIAERYTGRRVVKLGRAENREAAAFAERSASLGALQYRIGRATAQSQWLTMVQLMLLALIGLVAAVELLDISLSMITVATVIIMRVVPLALSLNRLRQGLANRIANLERVTEVDAALEVGKETSEGASPCPRLAKAISLENVTVRYPGAERPALNGISATIPAFTMTALIGPSGAGKSTLVDLLPRLNDASSGRVLWDGIPADSFALSSLRSHIAFMPQQAILFDDSVANNVRYFRPEATPAEVEEACRQAYAHEFIERLPQGYDTTVGEGGCQLSGGQRQRLALARALLTQADILILDEPTSAIDPESEARIQSALDALLAARRMTLIVIAHRPSTICNATHLLVLKDGAISYEGAPDAHLAEQIHSGGIIALDQGSKERETTPHSL